MDRDYVVGQWRRKRLARVPSRAEFPGRENGNDDDCRSAVHHYSVGRRGTVTRAVTRAADAADAADATRAPGAPGATRVPGATHSSATAANNAGVHI